MNKQLANLILTLGVTLMLGACGGGSSGNTANSTASGRIPDSGQTQCFYIFTIYPEAWPCMGTSGTPNGQDGDYTINAMSFTDKGNGTILDNVTGLLWRKCALGGTGNDCLGGTTAAYTWSNAQAQCAALGAGWRLPELFELAHIIDYSTSYSTINGAAFPATAPAAFWSATAHALYTTTAWTVNFAQGTTGVDYKTNTNYVRCVSG